MKKNWGIKISLFLSIMTLFLPLSLFASSQKLKIKILMTVDWEGRILNQSNLNAMKKFRKDFPHIPMLHFLNAAYYTKKEIINSVVAKDETTQKIRSVLLPIDEEGLHIHGWNSLLTACGLSYRPAPVFGQYPEYGPGSGGDFGHTVSIEHAYSTQELTKLIKCSKEILMNAGFDEAISFRAGGWMQGKKLAKALSLNNIRYDSSRAYPDFLIPSWGDDSNIVKMIRELHPNAGPLDQPFEIKLRNMENVTELPDNACLADYTTSEQIFGVFQKLVDFAKKSKTDKYMVMGFHQETANSYLPRVIGSIPLMEKLADKENIEIEWVLPKNF